MLGFTDTLRLREMRLMADMGRGFTDETADYATEGLLAGTEIATTMGWRPVEAVAVGDGVLTFDNGVQVVRAITRTPLASHTDLPSFAHPVLVPVGALGNAREMTLLPDQSVMVESDAAETLFGDPFAILKARDLVGLRGIDRVSDAPASLEVITLHFESDEVLHADGGALIVSDADVPGSKTLEFLGAARLPAPYEVYSGGAARCLVAAMAEEDARLGEGGPNRPAA